MKKKRQQNLNLQKVQYQIIHFSSEDPNYPIQELLQLSSESRGWQCQRYAAYPQEIVLQLVTPCRVQTMQFMSH